MQWRIISEIQDIQLIAVGRSIHELRRLRKAYGGKNWRKLKGVTMVELADGRKSLAEVHWYECHGIGRREPKIKRFLE